jgi:hypothetical protein
MRRILFLSGLIVASLSSAELPRYTVVPIQSFNLTYGEAIVRGNVFGGSYSAGLSRAYIERAGVYSDLLSVDPSFDTSLFGVNGDGQGVGGGKANGNPGNIPVRWELDNSLTMLGLSNLQPSAIAFDIADGGHAAGMIHALDWFDNADANRRACYWSPSGAITVIDTAHRGIAWSVNSSGWVTGFIDFPGTASRPFLWKGAGAVKIEIPAQYQWGVGKAISDFGEIAGILHDANNVNHAFIRRIGGTIEEIDAPNSYLHVEAAAINNLGVVAGDLFKTNFDYANHYGMVWLPNEGPTDVNDMLDLSDGWTVKWVRGINDDGVMSGQAEFDGVGYPVKLVPVSDLRIDSLNLTPTMKGGTTTSLSVVLNGPAPVGGIVVSIDDDSTSLTTPATITVPEGQTVGSANVTTSPVALGTTVHVRALLGLGGKITSTQIVPAALKSISSTGSVTGGTGASGTVLLDSPAPVGGIIVDLSDDLPSATVPAHVTVLAGKTTVNFSIATVPTAAFEQGSVRAAIGPQSVSTPFEVRAPMVLSVTFSASPTLCQTPLSVVVKLTGPAPAGGSAVMLDYPTPLVITGPASLMIAAGSDAKSIAVTTNLVSIKKLGQVSASRLGSTIVGSVDVLPTLKSLALAPSSVKGGDKVTAVLTLGGSAPTAGLLATLSTTLPGLTVPASVRVLAGKTSATFTVTVRGVNAATTGLVKATFKSRILSAKLNLAPPALVSFTLTPSSLKGGTAVTGKVTLDSLASLAGSKVSLQSSSTALAVPASVTVPAGAKSISFSLLTKKVTAISIASVTAKLAMVTKLAKLTIKP